MGDGLEDVKFVDLAIVMIEVAVLESVLERLEGVVEVAPPTVWRMESHGHAQGALERLAPPKERHHALAKASPLGGEVNPMTGVAVAVVHARRPRETQGLYFAHGTFLAAGATGTG